MQAGNGCLDRRVHIAGSWAGAVLDTVILMLFCEFQPIGNDVIYKHIGVLIAQYFSSSNEKCFGTNLYTEKNSIWKKVGKKHGDGVLFSPIQLSPELKLIPQELNDNLFPNFQNPITWRAESRYEESHQSLAADQNQILLRLGFHGNNVPPPP